MNRTITIIVAGVLGTVLITGCVDRSAQDQSKRTESLLSDPSRLVQVGTQTTQTMSDNLEVTGQFATSQDSQIGPKIGGKLIMVDVQDGSPVSAGQVIAKVDTTQLQAQYSQALASVQVANATYQSASSQLTQAIRNATINPNKSSAALRQAQAQLRAAKAALTKALNGARPQERIQAEANLRSAKVNYETQRKELDRVRTLVAQGALAGNRLDSQLASYEAAKTQLDNANQALSLIQAGTRQEDIDAAREQVRQAEDGVENAKASKDLDPLLKDQVSAAKAQVASAKAQIQNAEASVRIAKQALDDTLVVAPFSGRVNGPPVQIGTVVAAGTPIVHLVGGSGLYFEADVPEDKVSLVSAGKPVTVMVDSLGTTVQGSVVAVSPKTSAIARQFTARVMIPNPPSAIKAGMFGHAFITLRQVPSTLVAPQTAVVVRDGRNVVFTVESGKAKMNIVETGLKDKGLIEVKGLAADAQVVVTGQQGLDDGAPVKIDTKAAPASGASGSKS